jgi:hypothetical protein
MADLVAKDAFDRLPETYRRRAREIAARVREIDALMAPCNLDAIRDAVIRLRRQLRPQPDTDPAGIADGFKEHCRDLPEWALSEATNDFLAGRVDNHTGQFMPTCAEFAKRARSIMLPFLSERAALRIEASKLVERAEDEHRRHLIAIERQDPAVRQRVATMVEEATSGMVKGALRAEHGRLTDQTRAKLDALRKPRGFVSKIEQTKIVRGGA